MKTIAIHGHNWNHAQDIIKRGVFEWFHLTPVEIGDDIPTENIDAHMIFLPITETRKRIMDIIWNTHSLPTIINFSGIQETSPTQLFQDGIVSNIHFLFGPNMQAEDLKASLATTDHTQSIISWILANIERLWIRVIPHTKEDHDKKVAITQGLAHTLFLAMSEIGILPHTLFERWKQVPASTSGGMIHLNRFVRACVETLIERIETWISVRESLQEIVSWAQIAEFTTPNFDRIFKGIMGFNGEDTNISEEILDARKRELVGKLKEVLELRQHELVQLIKDTRNGIQWE
jgi:hypothetical protein